MSYHPRLELKYRFLGSLIYLSNTYTFIYLILNIQLRQFFWSVSRLPLRSGSFLARVVC